MQAQPIYDCCVEAMREMDDAGYGRPHVIFLTAGGKTLTQERCKELAQKKSLLLVCGHYEGIDERVIDALADEEISIGDYVLTGGELGALVVADSVFRMRPGVLSCEEGFQDESYYSGLLEYPQYTRPGNLARAESAACFAFRQPCPNCKMARRAGAFAHERAQARFIRRIL